MCKVVYDRYNLLTRVYLNYSNFHYKDMKYLDYQESCVIQENSQSKEHTSIMAYSKDNKFTIMHYAYDINTKESMKLDELVRIEFRDGDTYYDIDVKNKTYTKENYELGNALMIRKINEMEYKLDYKLNLSSGWGRLFFACNYFYSIYIREINGWKDIIIEPRYLVNYKDRIQVRASYLCNSDPCLHYMMDTYKDNQHITEQHEWSPEEEEYAKDWQVELPDLTEYTLIEK